MDVGLIRQVNIDEQMRESYLDYAMSVIVARALPDARDGLKPVHRRILYGMFDQGLRPDRPRMKCARATGDVMGKFHPHGQQAIYDALVRMAQPFSLRHPLIDFHGNYGSPDYPPAAMRYTECRLAPLAMHMLAGIDEDTVGFIDTYDGKTQEPAVPSAPVPHPLLQRARGISLADGPHNPPHKPPEVIYSPHPPTR